MVKILLYLTIKILVILFLVPLTHQKCYIPVTTCLQTALLNPLLHHLRNCTKSSVLNNTLPVLCVLLPNKNKATYTTFFNNLRNICDQCDLILNPRLITADFEQSFLKSPQNVSPNSKMKGCNFHFNKCIFRKITDLGWQQQYCGSSIDDPYSIAALYRKACALAFVPVSNINQLWCTIMDNFDHVLGVQKFFDYVTDTWIDSDSLFPKKL